MFCLVALAAGGAYLYENDDAGGWGKCNSVGQGEHRHKPCNDCISAMQVGPRTKVTLCKRAGTGGCNTFVNADAPCMSVYFVGNDVNDADVATVEVLP